MSPTYRPRVPHWVRASVVTLGYASPVKRMGAFCYERLLERAALRLSATLPLNEVLVRGSRPEKTFHPGLSDLDLILVSDEDSLSQERKAVLKARELVRDIRRGWHPLGEVSWLAKSEKKILLEYCAKHANFFGSRSFQRGAWRSRPLCHDFSLPQFERALERYLDGFSLWHIGKQKGDPHSVTLSHMRKAWGDALTFLNETGVELRSARDFQNRPPDLTLLGELCALCGTGLDTALRRLSTDAAPTEVEVASPPFLAELDWVLAHQRHLFRRYTECVEPSKTLGLNAQSPLFFGVAPQNLSGSQVARFLEIAIEETSSLRHAFLFPLLPPALAEYFKTRLMPRNQNRRYLHGATRQWTPMPPEEWQQLACEAVMQISALLMDPEMESSLLNHGEFLPRFKACPDVPQSVRTGPVFAALSTKTRLLTMLTA